MPPTPPEALWLDSTRSLLGVLSHDLRNPLTALRANGALLAEVLDPRATEAREVLADLLASVQSLDALVANMDALGRLEALAHGVPGPPWGAPGPLELRALLHQRVASLPEGPTRPTLELPHDEALVRGPEGALVTLCDNLLAALQETPSRGPRPWLGLVHQGGKVTLYATRPGRPWTSAQECFAREAQRPETRVRPARGLALYLVGLAARALGGDAQLDEARGTLALELPKA